ncbi:hypothetical protein GQ43DRAFT_65845 [Delitschia confertaspora ATCC 74209]|uniref:Jacalin-type lectin domain-containing protein n=1 Tax=Delitschia confertaspora ATCC 74209 TaxID=1513339 RepID=A0A9P4MY81_9PLEO|nr:hypothetical protein GQ43DRAFT_65845 [Delitschia confertaspora ATCC 74209]
MPSFLHNFRSKSRSNIKTDKAPADSTTKATVHGPFKRKKSSSSLNSRLESNPSNPSTSPSASILPREDSVVTTPNGVDNGIPPLPTPRPTRPAVNTTVKRYSMNGLTSVSINGSQRSLNQYSLLAPRVTSVSEGSWVHQKVLLIHGRIGDPSVKPQNGMVTVNHHNDNFPPTTWPVNDSYFKALIHLDPGHNRLRLDYNSPKASAANTSIPAHSSFLNVCYLPLNTAPPLQLAIILGKDSPGTYDAMPDRMQREGNSLDLAVKKYRMAAYLWQVFTGEQMQRHGFGRRCFRLEEEWQPGTLTFHDWATGQLRTEAKVHIIRCNKTVAEIRDLDRAQQYDKAKRKGDLFGIAAEAVKDYFKISPGQKQYVSCMFLDAHWDPSAKTIRGHAALGGGDGELQLAIFGSHALQSYPSSIEEVWQAFQDCTRTDTAFVANDCNESGSSWEAANIGIGAHLHEVGHLFGCPHQESGIMLRDYVTLNRTFTCREPFSTRTGTKGHRLVLPEDECGWHRLDTLRFRFHPCFRIPTDAPIVGDGSVQVWTVDNGQGGVIATSQSGIAWIEIFPDGDDVCHYWREYPREPTEGNSGSGYLFPRQAALVESELRDLLPKAKRNSRLKLHIYSGGGEKHEVKDYNLLSNPKHSRIRIPDGRWGYRGNKLGCSQMEGSQPQDLILESAYIQTKLLVSIRVYHGFAVDGIEFFYEDNTSQLFGKRGGKPGGTDFPLDTRKGELLMGFCLRAGLWIDGLQILTSLGRKSEWFGNPHGGSSHTLIPPRGYTIGGVSGSCGPWLDGFTLIITR